jgi:aspartate-semialdehyde dehydrogenase
MKSLSSSSTLGIIGATGLVGQELLALLAESSWSHLSLRLWASEKSAGQHVPYRDKALVIESLEATDWTRNPCAIYFLCADAETSRRYAPILTQHGSIVVDNSSAFRMDPRVPLVIPEVNAADLRSEVRLVANPNCTTIISLMALAPLLNLTEITSVRAATYQAISGAGMQALLDLKSQTLDYLQSKASAAGKPLAFNVYAHESALDAAGYCEEENKLIDESRKILKKPHLDILATTMRVPVLRTHTVVLYVQCQNQVHPQVLLEAWRSAPGLKVVQNWGSQEFPSSRSTMGGLLVEVGRLRTHPDNDLELNFIVCGDQLLKGAAQNALQIAMLMAELNA